MGETITRKSKARIIAATNRNLREAVNSGTFRDDVYHRLHVFFISVPPLRELGADKIVQLNHFRAIYASQFKQRPFKLSPEAKQVWKQYGFPGNTRELRNIVIRLSTKYPGMTITQAQLHEELDQQNSPTSLPLQQEMLLQQLSSGKFDLTATLRAQEVYYIKTALNLTSGNVTDASKLLCINRTTLHSRLDAQAKLGRRI